MNHLRIYAFMRTLSGIHKIMRGIGITVPSDLPENLNFIVVCILYVRRGKLKYITVFKIFR